MKLKLYQFRKNQECVYSMKSLSELKKNMNSKILKPRKLNLIGKNNQKNKDLNPNYHIIQDLLKNLQLKKLIKNTIIILINMIKLDNQKFIKRWIKINPFN